MNAFGVQWIVGVGGTIGMDGVYTLNTFRLHWIDEVNWMDWVHWIDGVNWMDWGTLKGWSTLDRGGVNWMDGVH